MKKTPAPPLQPLPNVLASYQVVHDLVMPWLVVETAWAVLMGAASAMTAPPAMTSVAIFLRM